MRRLRRLRQRDSSGAALLHRLRVAIGQQAEAPLEAIDRALDEAPPPLKTSVLALAARTTSVDFIEPVLQRAKLLERGRQRVYNAAVGVVARDRATNGRTERTLALVDRMRQDGVRPSNYTLQQVFAAARGEASGVDELLEILSEQMRHGLRPSRAAFDKLLRAVPVATPADNVGQARLPLLLQVLDACSLRPSGQTARVLAQLANTPTDLAALDRLVAALPTPVTRSLHLDGTLLAARGTVDPNVTAEHTLSRRSGEASVGETRALLWACAGAGAHHACHALLEDSWSRGIGVDERTARRLLHTSGEGAHVGAPGALELLLALSDAMFAQGEATAVVAQRGTRRRSAGAEHEAVRVLARAQWLAGLGSAASVYEHAINRLQIAHVPPRPRLVATCVYLAGMEGDFDAALRMLSSSNNDKPAAFGEGVYLSLLYSIRQPTQVEHAISAIRCMLAAGVAPSVRTRIALARLAIRVQRENAEAHARGTERAGHVHGSRPPLPGASRFWRTSALPWDSLFDALRREDAEETSGVDAGPAAGTSRRPHGHMAAAADLILDAQAAALLERIAQLMNASQDGSAMAELLRASAQVGRGSSDKDEVPPS